MKGIAGGTVHKMPEDLRRVLISEPKARVLWDDITPLARNEWICWVISGKKAETRDIRIKKALSKMKGGMRRPCCWTGCIHPLKTIGIWYSESMTKNPYHNAIFAALYIVFVVLLISYGPALVRDKPDTILAPIAMLSLLVCSVAFMAYAFFFYPVQMFIDGQKREAVELFTKTLTTFAVITGIVVLIAFTV